MQPVRDRADYIINTQNLTLAQLHKKLCRLFTETGEAKLPINVVAFGYKYGIPIDADLVLDVRFLPNPYYIEELKDLSGLDQPVYDFVMQQPDTAEYMRLLTAPAGGTGAFPWRARSRIICSSAGRTRGSSAAILRG